jgi:flagellar M-ring protein FliF
MFGLRPAVRTILAAAPPGPAAGTPAVIANPGAVAALPAGALPGGSQPGGGPGTVNLIEDVTTRMNRSPQKRLEQIVEYDEAQAAAILRQWLRQDEAVA